MHPVQEHINTMGTDCLVQWSIECHIYKKERTVFQPRVLQSNFHNINRLPNSKYPTEKKIREYTPGGGGVLSPKSYVDVPAGPQKSDE